jgi:hypothetical protein
MILSGLISLAFYKRGPTVVQISLDLADASVLSALLV